MNEDLVLVSLTAEQIAKAKEKNGQRKQITHALVVGKHGIMYGTEKQCRKYYSVWCDIFKHLFGNCYETGQYQLNDFKDSGNVVMSLIEDSDKQESKRTSANMSNATQQVKPKKKSFLARLFGV